MNEYFSLPSEAMLVFMKYFHAKNCLILKKILILIQQIIAFSNIGIVDQVQIFIQFSQENPFKLVQLGLHFSDMSGLNREVPK